VAYLEWGPDIVEIDFESKTHVLEAADNLAAHTCIPDFPVVFDSGQAGIVEAKASRRRISHKQTAQLALSEAHFERGGFPFEVVYRDELQKDGFIETIFPLRHYARLTFNGALWR
jgi:hypothetical protein